jgi:hypothetical protein
LIPVVLNSPRIAKRETCGGISYDTKALQATVASALTAQALSTLGNGYHLVGPISLTQRKLIRTKGAMLLTVSAEALWGYLPSERQQQTLKNLIAGKPMQEAVRLLLAQPGIERVNVSGMIGTMLPRDSGRIHLRVVNTPAQ